MNESAHLLRPAGVGSELTESGLQRQLGDSQLVRVRRGLYVPASTVVELDRVGRHRIDIAAAVPEQVQPGAVSHISAAVLHGLPIWDVPLERVHLTKQRKNAGRRDGGLHVHAAGLDRDEIVELDGVPATSLLRTLLDLALTVSFESAVVLVDAALHRRLVDPAALRRALEVAIGRHGRERAARVFAFADGRSESVGESRSRVGIHRAGLAVPGLQREICRADGSLVARTDFDWDWLIGEFDGLAKYGRLRRPGETPGDALAREKHREDELRDLGHDIIRWIWTELASAALYERIGRSIARSSAWAR